MAQQLVEMFDLAARSGLDFVFVDHETERVGMPQLWSDAGARVKSVLDRSCDASGELRVGAVLTTSRPSVTMVLATVRAGVTLCSLPTPARSQDIEAYKGQLQAMAEQAQLSTVTLDDEYAPYIEIEGVEVLPYSAFLDVPARTDTGESVATWGLIQFTSGATGTPKGLRLGEQKLIANILAILGIVQPGSDYTACSWLPLSHDMGMVGVLLSSLVGAGTGGVNDLVVVLVRPEAFVRSPWEWMDLASSYRAVLTAGPDFGYRLAARSRRRNTTLDLSRLACAIVGAEPLQASTLSAFEGAFAGAGFNSTAFAPAYGMAEAALALSMNPLGTGWREVQVEGHVLGEGSGLPVSAMPYVSSGAPLVPGSVSTWSNDAGVSELVVDRSIVIPHYLDGSPTSDDDRWFRTGDIGTIVDGEVIVVSRSDDVLVVRGRNISAIALESGLSGSQPSIGAVAAYVSSDGLVLLVEEARSTRHGPPCDQARLARECIDAVGVRPVRVEVLPHSSLPRTPSGKLRRVALAMVDPTALP